MKKAVSLWIVLNAPKHMDGVVEFTKYTKKSPIRKRRKDRIPYDKSEIVEIYISSKHDLNKKYEKYDEILTPLFVLFNNKLDLQTKMKILKEYNFTFDEQLERKVNGMCNLGEAIRQETIREEKKKWINQGKKQGKKKWINQGKIEGKEEGDTNRLVKDIEKFVTKLNYTVEEALAFLEVPKKDWNKYISLLNK